LGRYTSFLETTRSSDSWSTEAMRDVGALRRLMRSIDANTTFGSSHAREVAEQMKNTIGRLRSYPRHPSSIRLQRSLERLDALCKTLAASPGQITGGLADTRPTETWLQQAAAYTDTVQSELRLIRRSSSFKGG
jgi:hypothetical protein